MTFAQAQNLATRLGRSSVTPIVDDSTNLAAVQAAPVVTAAASGAFSAERVATTGLEVSVDTATPGVISWLVV